jgi:hypothetical protein
VKAMSMKKTQKTKKARAKNEVLISGRKPSGQSKTESGRENS